MAVTVTVEDTYNAQRPFQRFSLSLASETVPASELIARRVRREIENNAGQIAPLVQPGDVETALNDSDEQRERRIERSVTAAVNGLSKNAFFLLVDDRQIESPNQLVTLTPASVVTFVRLIPLQGG